jgi:UDP-MurNAc hydroxylase
MKFQVISHACMQVDNGNRRLLVDPWIVGSAYWRSWWHFPESVPLNDEMLSSDWIYLTHQHFDHFHYPSLRKFRRDITVLVPKRPVPSMEEALKDLGFTRVVSMEHGVPMQLEGGLEVTSLQSNWNDDSALVVKGDGVTLLDQNDAKFEDPVFDDVVREFGPIDFVFKSHSTAQAYPDCYSSPDPKDLQHKSKMDYVTNFIHTARHAKARYAVPFASNVCYLHPETIDHNEDAISPLYIAEHHDRRPGDPEVTVMVPGSTWDSNKGFNLLPTDILRRKAQLIPEFARKYDRQIQEQIAFERDKRLEWSTFESYMGKFLHSLPLPLRLYYKARIAFHVSEDGREEYWVLDFGSGKVTRETSRPSEYTSINYVAPGLLQDAMEKQIVNFIDISKRLKVELAPGGAIDHFVFRELITLYEGGYFPLMKNFNKRFIGVWLARRGEVASYVRKALSGGVAGLIPKTEDVA